MEGQLSGPYRRDVRWVRMTPLPALMVSKGQDLTISVADDLIEDQKH